jgi:hypothetical protein
VIFFSFSFSSAVLLYRHGRGGLGLFGCRWVGGWLCGWIVKWIVKWAVAGLACGSMLVGFWDSCCWSFWVRIDALHCFMGRCLRPCLSGAVWTAVRGRVMGSLYGMSCLASAIRQLFPVEWDFSSPLACKFPTSVNADVYDPSLLS